MKGIREAALSEDEPIKKYPGYIPPDYHQNPYTSYEDPYANPYNQNLPYGQQDSLFDEELQIIKGQLKISVLIGINLLGDLINEGSPQFNMQKAEEKAEQLAWEEVGKLAAANFKEKYSWTTEIRDNIESFEVIITLNPITK